MYDELVKRLKYKAGWDESGDLEEAADAIEVLTRENKELSFRAAQLEAMNDALIGETGAADALMVVSQPKWIKIESRPMDAEERQYYSKQYGYELTDEEAVIYCSQLPEHGQEVLVCNKWGHIWIDTFDDDPDYGVGFETNGDMDGLVAWMHLPEPPKEE